MIGGLRQRLTQCRPTRAARKTVESAVAYFQNNRSRMCYDEYLPEGYPIASRPTCGRCPIESSCRHVVEDRLDRTGIRWTLDGALAMLATRTVSLSGNWSEYQTFRITREQKQLDPTTT